MSMNKIYTKTGDKGMTSLANGMRVEKHSLRVDTYGTVDETNSLIGVALAFDMPDGLRAELQAISNLLFNLGSDVATPFEPAPKFHVPRITTDEVEFLERAIDRYDESLEPLRAFILPGGTRAASFIHLARSVSRRAERLATQLAGAEQLNPNALVFLNRLSDYLFTAARYANASSGTKNVEWTKNPLDNFSI